MKPSSRRLKLEGDLAEAKFKLRYVKTLGRPSPATTSAIARWEADVARLQAALAKLAAPAVTKGPKVSPKPKATPWKLESQPASEPCECLECGVTIEAGRRQWWATGADGSMGPFCTRNHARQLVSQQSE
jgi:hypothetical protein